MEKIKNTISVLKINNTDSLLIKPRTFSNYTEYLLNGKPIIDEWKNNNLVISEDDKIEIILRPAISHYERDGEILSQEDYSNKSQYYDDDSSEDEVLQAIQNRKELSGFSPVYAEPAPEPVEILVHGYINDTGSGFISCAIAPSYKTNPVIYTVYGREISVDEYKSLSAEYSEHARFEKFPSNYLRFTKINGKFVFSDMFPFSDREHVFTFTNLEEAKEKEAEIRKLVKDVVLSTVFTEKITQVKRERIVAQLEMISKMGSQYSMKEALSVLIDDLQNYENIFIGKAV